MKMKDQCVVVTGAGSGIGRACALAFARQGACVVIADNNVNSSRDTLELIKKEKGEAIICEADVSDAGSVQRLVNETINAYSKVNVLVNNAAIQVNKTVDEITIDEWNRQWAVNVNGVFLCSRLFLPSLRETKGCIINMSSVNGYFVEPGCPGYCATKAAIIGLTKAMAIDHGHEGLRINCICPGYIDAGLAEGYFQSQPDPLQARNDAGKLHALNRIGKADEVANVAVFLASDAASFITGASLSVDGGFGAGIPPKK